VQTSNCAAALAHTPLPKTCGASLGASPLSEQQLHGGAREAASPSRVEGTRHTSPQLGQRATCESAAKAEAGGRFAASSRIITRNVEEGRWKKLKTGEAVRCLAAASRAAVPTSSRRPASLQPGNLCVTAAYPAAAWCGLLPLVVSESVAHR